MDDFDPELIKQQSQLEQNERRDANRIYPLAVTYHVKQPSLPSPTPVPPPQKSPLQLYSPTRSPPPSPVYSPSHSPKRSTIYSPSQSPTRSPVYTRRSPIYSPSHSPSLSFQSPPQPAIQPLMSTPTQPPPLLKSPPLMRSPTTYPGHSLKQTITQPRPLMSTRITTPPKVPPQQPSKPRAPLLPTPSIPPMVPPPPQRPQNIRVLEPSQRVWTKPGYKSPAQQSLWGVSQFRAQKLENLRQVFPTPVNQTPVAKSYANQTPVAKSYAEHKELKRLQAIAAKKAEEAAAAARNEISITGSSLREDVGHAKNWEGRDPRFKRRSIESEEFVSPLDSLYCGTDKPRTGRGYGVQKVKPPVVQAPKVSPRDPRLSKEQKSQEEPSSGDKSEVVLVNLCDEEVRKMKNVDETEREIVELDVQTNEEPELVQINENERTDKETNNQTNESVDKSKSIETETDVEDLVIVDEIFCVENESDNEEKEQVQDTERDRTNEKDEESKKKDVAHEILGVEDIESSESTSQNAHKCTCAGKGTNNVDSVPDTADKLVNENAVIREKQVDEISAEVTEEAELNKELTTPVKEKTANEISNSEVNSCQDDVGNKEVAEVSSKAADSQISDKLDQIETGEEANVEKDVSLSKPDMEPSLETKELEKSAKVVEEKPEEASISEEIAKESPGKMVNVKVVAGEKSCEEPGEKPEETSAESLGGLGKEVVVEAAEGKPGEAIVEKQEETLKDKPKEMPEKQVEGSPEEKPAEASVVSAEGTSKDTEGEKKTEEKPVAPPIEITQELVEAYLKKTLGQGSLFDALTQLLSEKKKKKKKRRRSSSSSSSTSSSSSSSSSSSTSESEGVREKKSKKKRKKKKKSKHKKKDVRNEEPPKLEAAISIPPVQVEVKPVPVVVEPVVSTTVEEKETEVEIPSSTTPEVVVKPKVAKNIKNTKRPSSNYAARKRILTRRMRSAQNNQKKKILRSYKTEPQNTKKGKHKKNELDKLHDDIRSMFISEDVMTATGTRQCRLNRPEIIELPEAVPEPTVVIERPPVRTKEPLDTSNELNISSDSVSSMEKLLEYPKLVIKKINTSPNNETSPRITRNVARRGGFKNVTNRRKRKTVIVPDIEKCELYLKRNLIKVKRVKENKIKMTFYTKQIADVVNKIYKRQKINIKCLKSLDELFQKVKKVVKKKNILTTSELIPYSFSKSEKKSDYLCILCKRTFRTITNHFKTAHPDNEVLISRLEAEEAEAAKLEALQSDMCLLDHKLSLAAVRNRVKNKLEHFTYNCRMCVFETGDVNSFFKHITLHTGEYRHKCPLQNCSFVARTTDTVRQHVMTKHKGKSDLRSKNVELFEPTIENEQLFGYLCSLCNFLQLLEVNVKKHCKTYHENETYEIIKINLSSKTLITKKSEPLLPAVESVPVEAIEKEEVRRYPKRFSGRNDDSNVESLETESKKRKREDEISDGSENEEVEPPSIGSDDDAPLKSLLDTKKNRSKLRIRDENGNKKTGVPKLLALEQALVDINIKTGIRSREEPKKILRGRLGYNEELIEIKMGPLGAELTPNGKLKYTCYIKGCIFVSCSFELFERHVLVTHSRSRWDGKCSSCTSESSKSLRLEAALEHLKFHERTNDDCVDAGPSDKDEDKDSKEDASEECPDDLSAADTADEPEDVEQESNKQHAEGTEQASTEPRFIEVKVEPEMLHEESCEPPEPEDEKPALTGELLEEPRRIRVKFLEGDLLSKYAEQSPAATPPPVEIHPPQQQPVTTTPPPIILPQLLIKVPEHAVGKIPIKKLVPNLAPLKQTPGFMKIIAPTNVDNLNVIPIRTPPSMSKTITITSSSVVDRNPMLNKPVLFPLARTQEAEDKIRYDLLKINKDEKIYASMLTDERLRDLFKCMGFECSFTTNLDYVFTQHYGLHDAQERLKNNRKKSKSNESMKLPWRQCSYCRCVLHCAELLTKHVLIVHGMSTYQCSYCFYRALSQHSLVFHQENVHTDKPLRVLRVKPTSTPEGSAKLESPKRQTVLRPYICEICVGKESTSRFYVTSEFYQHLVDKHSLVSTYCCHICKDLLLKPDRLITHYKLHSYSMFQCAYCLHGTEVEKEMMYHLANCHCGEPVHMYVRINTGANPQAPGADVLNSLLVIQKSNDIPGSTYVIEENGTSAVSTITSESVTAADISSISMDLSSIVSELGISVTDENDQEPTTFFKELVSISSGACVEPTVETVLPNARFSTDDRPQGLDIPLGELTPQMFNITSTYSASNELRTRKSPPPYPGTVTHKLPQVSDSRSKPATITSQAQQQENFTPMIQSVVSLAEAEKKKTAEPDADGSRLITVQVANRSILVSLQTKDTDKNILHPPVISVDDIALLDKPVEETARPVQDLTKPIQQPTNFAATIKDSLEQKSNLFFERLKRKMDNPGKEPAKVARVEEDVDIITIDDEDETSITTKNDEIRKEIEELRKKMSDKTDSLLVEGGTSKDIPEPPTILPLQQAISSLNKKLELEKVQEKEREERRASLNNDDSKDDGDKDSSDSEQVSSNKLKFVVGLSCKELNQCGNKDCNFAGQDSRELKDHLLVCDYSRNSAMLTCVHCKKQFKLVQHYLDHLKYHGVQRFLCSSCEFRSPVLHSTKGHVKRVHKIPSVKTVPFDPSKVNIDTDIFYVCSVNQNPNKAADKTVFGPGEEDLLPQRSIYQNEVRCSMCPYHTKVRSNMVRHLKFHSSAARKGVKVPSTAPTNPVPCLENKEKMFDKMTNLAASSILEQPNKKTDQISPEEEAKLPKYVPEQLRYMCSAPDCKYITVDETMLRAHMRTLHYDISWYSCPHCQSTVILEMRQVAIDRIGLHLRFHDNKLYKCAHCTYYHYQKHTVEKHLSEKHGDKWFHYYTIRDPGLEQASEDEPVAAASAQENNVERVWKCNLCDVYTTSKKASMLDHLLKSHNTKSKYKCSLCKFKTNYPQYFSSHFLSKHSGYECRYNKTFDRAAVTDETETLCENKEEEFDTTPLWSRENRVRHIRGILIEDEEETPKEKKRKPVKRTNSANEEEKQTTQVLQTNDTFNCPLCTEKPFLTKHEMDFRLHLFKELNYNQYSCKNCSTCCVDRKEFRKHHNKSHPGLTEMFENLPEDCEITYWVDEVTNRQKELMNERKFKRKRTVSEEDESKTSYKCPHCQHKSVDGDKIKKHILKNHLVLGTWMCGLCTGTFISENSVKKHLVNTHKDLKSDKKQKYWHYHTGLKFKMEQFWQTNYFSKGLPAKNKLFFCKYCKHETYRRCNLITHFKRVHPDKPIAVDHYFVEIDKSSTDDKHLEPEEEVDVEKVDVLPKIGTTFSIGLLGADESYEPVETSYTCPRCQLTTQDLNTINVHLIIHVPTYKCVQCNEMFLSEDDYNKHDKTDDCFMIVTSPPAKLIQALRQDVIVKRGDQIKRGLGTTYLARKSTAKLPTSFKQIAKKSTTKLPEESSRYNVTPEQFDENKINTKIKMGVLETSVSVNVLSKIMKLFPVVKVEPVENEESF